jgi:hypothetical protein
MVESGKGPARGKPFLVETNAALLHSIRATERYLLDTRRKPRACTNSSAVEQASSLYHNHLSDTYLDAILVYEERLITGETIPVDKTYEYPDDRTRKTGRWIPVRMKRNSRSAIPCTRMPPCAEHLHAHPLAGPLGPSYWSQERWTGQFIP